MNDDFDELVTKLGATGIAVDAPFLHGLLTGSATIPMLDLDKLFVEIAAEHALPASTRQSVIDVVDFLSEDLFNMEFEAHFQIDLNNEAQRWIQGYLKAVSIHDTQWQEQNELHLDAAMVIIMFTSMVDEDFRRDLDMESPGTHGLRDDPQMLSQLAQTVYQCFHGNLGDELDLFDDDELPPLLRFSAEELADMDERALFAHLVAHEDRLPLEFVHECANRGEAIVPLLREHLDIDAHWANDADPFEWWGLLHAVFVLGLIPGEASAQALLEAFQRIHADANYDVSDWFSSFWPALCRNKTKHTADPMRSIAMDKAAGWYARTQAIECVLAAAAETGKAKLETTLDWLAAMCGDPSETPEFRVTAGNCLLDHPRERYRQLLQDLVGLQTPENWFHHSYSLQEIDVAFDDGDNPEWSRFDNPWQFYDPDEIQRRQARWLEEENDFAEDLFDLDETGSADTYVREQPKIGRNDPCPCGSGKKYKKCCLKKLH